MRKARTGETDRLILRRPRLADAEAVFAACDDREVSRYMA
jgi:RimJ/RimL family protein N-acetyltransferase